MTLIRLAIKNLLRKKVRSIVIICAAALAAGLIFSATTILQSAKTSLELGIDRLGADIMVVPAEYEVRGQKVLLAGEPTAFYMDQKNFDKVMAIPGVKQAAPQLFMASAVLECCVTPNVLLVGYDPKRDFTISPWVRLSAKKPKKYENLDSVTIGGNLSYLSSEDVRYYGKQFWVGSVLYPSGLGFFDTTVFMTMDVARDMITQSKTWSKKPLNISPDTISSILVKIDRGFNVRTVGAEIERSIPGVIAIRTRDLVAAERQNIETALWGVIAAGIAFWAMLLIMLGLVFAMNVNERGRELGILRAMGASRGHIFGLILSEAMLLTIAGGTIGIAMSWILIVNFKNLIIAWLGNMHFLWPSSFYIGSIGLACLLLMLVSGAASALYPAAKSCLREPYEAIHRGM